MKKAKIRTNDEYVTSTIDETHLEEIIDDLKSSNELIAFKRNPDRETITVVLSLAEFQSDLNYIW